MSSKRSKRKGPAVVIVTPVMDYSDAAKAFGLTDGDYWREMEDGGIVTLQIRTTTEADTKARGRATESARRGSAS